MDLVLVVANIVLVCVTAAYVVLTKRMADSSEITAKAAQESAEAAKESAEAARVAAEATKESAVAAMANLSVAFTVEPEFYDNSEEEVLLVRVNLTNTGGTTLVVHDLRLDPIFVGVYDFDNDRLNIDMNRDGHLTRTRLLHEDRNYFMHQGEVHSLEVDPIDLHKRQSCEGSAVILYSFDGNRENARTYYKHFHFIDDFDQGI